MPLHGACAWAGLSGVPECGFVGHFRDLKGLVLLGGSRGLRGRGFVGMLLAPCEILPGRCSDYSGGTT